MSDEGEKTCPLCAEEMDLTDQQLRPCKCGYDICVWCWHHIMDMAEKDDTEGRCPACRTPYNKEKIVGTASKCERLVAEMSVEKKQKSLKGKTRTSEGRKQLSSVRVIQRNLVYIVGLPLNLADEDILQRKEYFGQYGKVVKVSISRTAAGSIQHFANNTCSVYITYSKEDEAVRSIQAVHGFVLEGRPLRACFGTTKYCHAWLRNMPCTNPECLYLHEFGSQEDSFTKDEIISEYTRGRVQQVSGGTNDIQRRSGNILPPVTTTDDYTSYSWPKPPTNDTTTSMKSSPPSSSSGTSVAWGTHGSNSQAVAVTSNGPSKQKVVNANENHSEESNGISQESSTSTINSHISSKDKNEANFSTSETYRDKDLDVSNQTDNLSSAMSSLNIARNPSQPFPLNKPNPIPTMDNNNINRLVPDFQNNNNIINKVEEEEEEEEEVVAVSEAETEADLLSFNHQRLSDPQLVTHTNYLPQSSSSSSSSSLLNDYSPFGNHDRGSLFNMPVANNVNVNGDSFFQGSNGHSYFPPSNTGGGSSKMANNYNNGSIDSGENNMISNILSMDFDPWDDSLTSPQNLSKLLHNNQTSPQILSRKPQNSNQSRFSFAREEDEHQHQRSKITQNLHNNGFSSFNFEESPSSKISVSRSQISAPPGFMGPTRAPPPGFTSNERIIQHASYDNLSGNHMYDTSSSSSILRKPHHHHQAPVYNSEIELMDPAILAIGTATTSRDMFPSSHHHQHHHHHGSFENDNRLRLLMQTSFSHQNQRFSEIENGYGVSSRIPESSSYQNGFQQQPRMSNNGHWDSWNEVQNRNGNGNGNAIAELLRNERLGFNKYYSGL